MKTAEIIAKIRDLYEATGSDRDRVFDEFLGGKVSGDMWRYADAELTGMRAAYLTILDMLEA